MNTPKRDTFPITAGKEPQWDLSPVASDYMLAELIRRGYGTMKAFNRLTGSISAESRVIPEKLRKPVVKKKGKAHVKSGKAGNRKLRKG